MHGITTNQLEYLSYTMVKPLFPTEFNDEQRQPTFVNNSNDRAANNNKQLTKTLNFICGDTWTEDGPGDKMANEKQKLYDGFFELP